MKPIVKTIIILAGGAISIGALWYFVFSPKRVIKNNSDTNIAEIDVIKVLDNGNAHVNIKYLNGELSQDSVMTGGTLSSLKALGVKVVYLPA